MPDPTGPTTQRSILFRLSNKQPWRISSEVAKETVCIDRFS